MILFLNGGHEIFIADFAAIPFAHKTGSSIALGSTNSKLESVYLPSCELAKTAYSRPLDFPNVTEKQLKWLKKNLKMAITQPLFSHFDLPGTLSE